MDAGPSDEQARALLARPPTRPDRIERFTSNTLFGQPGIYPDGPVMVPASDGGVDGGVDDLVEAALAELEDGPARPLLDAFRSGTAAFATLGLGVPASPGRVVGPTADGPPDHRVINFRYRHEHPAVVAPSVAHALGHHGDRASNAEEATLHGILAAQYTWALSRRPELADLGTELSRRQASLTITLLNARPPGGVDASIRRPDGPGTIPGGDPHLQCPDLWSIPFTSRDPADCDLEVPPAVAQALMHLTAGPTAGVPPVPATYGDELGDWLTAHLGEGPWFGPVVRARAGLALGLFSPPVTPPAGAPDAGDG